MKSRLSFIFYMIIIIAMVSLITIGCVDKSTHITDEEFQAAWNEIYAEGEYEADGVVVILTLEETRKFKTYTAEDFAEAGDLVIQQDDYRRASYMKAVLAGETNTQMPWLDAETYQQGLSLRLTTPTKENIVRACILLSRRPEVEDVYPVVYADIAAGKTSKSIHDPYYITEEEYLSSWQKLFLQNKHYVKGEIYVNLTHEESLLFKEYSVSDFIDVGTSKIDYDDSYLADYVRRKLFGLPWNHEDVDQIDVNTYQRQIVLRLQTKDYESIAKAYTLLMRKKEVASAFASPYGELDSEGDPPVNLGFWYYNEDFLNIATAWRLTQGDEDILVGVIDTGIDGNHDDLINQIDHSVDTKHMDFTTDLDVGTPVTIPVDDVGHGTHVAGIIAAEGINYQPVGVAPGVRLVSLRVGDCIGTNPIDGNPILVNQTSWLINAINYANQSANNIGLIAHKISVFYNNNMEGVV